MRLQFTTQAAAQAKADAIHAWMQSNNAAYAASVTAGRTLAACKPYQDRDKDGKVVGTSWYINLKVRHQNSLSVAEKQTLTEEPK